MTTTTRERIWTDQQRAIFDWFREGTGNLVIRARAGTGKSTSLVEAINYAPETDILLCAFNKRIQKDLASKVNDSEANGKAEVKTLHGVGCGIVYRYWKGCQLDKTRSQGIALRVMGDQAPDDMVKVAKKLAGIAKGALPSFDPANQALVPALCRLAKRFDAEPDSEWQSDGWTTEKIAKYVVDMLDLSRKRNPEGPCVIDFDDMIFVPLANNWANPRYDLVAVDEAQDMGVAQLSLARRVLIPSGRLVFVGDNFQAIYGFRGADSDSLDRLKRETGAAELSITKTFRCGKAIVEYAKTLVPDFEADEGNNPGEVRKIKLAELVDEVQVGDFILSRKNAPLAQICLKIIRSGKPARIEGKDVGAGLRAIASRWKVKTVTLFLERVAKWSTKEMARLDKEGTQESADKIVLVKDQAEILVALCDGLDDKEPYGVIQRLFDLFGDADDNPPPAVVCSSIHKAKGLEAKRVFVLRSTLYPKRRVVNAETRKSEYFPTVDVQEERNLDYVASTRAIETLVWVDDV